MQVVNEHQNVEVYVKATPAKIGEFQAACDKHNAQLQDGLIKMVDHFLRRELANNIVDRRDTKKRTRIMQGLQSTDPLATFMKNKGIKE